MLQRMAQNPYNNTGGMGMGGSPGNMNGMNNPRMNMMGPGMNRMPMGPYQDQMGGGPMGGYQGRPTGPGPMAGMGGPNMRMMGPGPGMVRGPGPGQYNMGGGGGPGMVGDCVSAGVVSDGGFCGACGPGMGVLSGGLMSGVVADVDCFS